MSAQGPKALRIVNARLVDRDRDGMGSLLVYGGKIFSVTYGAAGKDLPDGIDEGDVEVIDASLSTVMPAFVDLHAHFRDPGQTRKEDLESASRAAVAGGYATVVLMANTDPVCSTADQARDVRARAGKLGLVDAYQAVSLTPGFSGSVANDFSSIDRREVPIVTEDGREVASAAVMLDAMRLAGERGLVVSCHCEDADLAARARAMRSEAFSHPDAKREWLKRAGETLALAEDLMTARNVSLAREAGCRVHIAHVSTARSIEIIRRAKRDIPVTCEVTPHHLALNDETLEIVNPPLRGESDREALLAACADGTIDAIATDHAPHTAEDKAAFAPGFSGIQTAFSVSYTALVRGGGISLSRLSELMSASPAAILGLERGLLRPGMDADLVIVDPEREVHVGSELEGPWYSKSRNSPFMGMRLHGAVLATFRLGNLVYSRDVTF